MYFYLACFWFIVGVLAQIFRADLEPVLGEQRINVMSFLCFVLLCYNMIRWRMTRALKQALEKANEHRERARHVEREPDPTFDFSKDDEKKPPQ